MSVHPHNGAFVVLWREGVYQRSKRFDGEAEAIVFDQSLEPPVDELPKSAIPSVSAYATAKGLRWRYQFRDSRGRQSTKRGFLTARAAARHRERLLARKHGQGLYVSRSTFGEFFESWLRSRKPYLAPGTFSDYEIHGRLRLLPAFAHRRLPAISGPEVRGWLIESDESGDYARKTLNNALGVLSAAFASAVRDRLVARNPVLEVERLPLDHIERDWLRRHEIDGYLDACSDVYRPLATLLIASGLRISEALALVWNDIDFDRSVIRVYRSARGDGVGKTKSKRFRAVRVGPEALETLRYPHAAQPDGAELVFTRPDDSRGGRLLDRTTVSSRWHKEALEDAGLRDMPLHALRHTAAARWLLAGKPLIYVQRQLGHSSITTTEAFYGHLEDDSLGNASDTGDLVFQASRQLLRGPALRADERPSATRPGRVRYQQR